MTRSDRLIFKSWGTQATIEEGKRVDEQTQATIEANKGKVEILQATIEANKGKTAELIKVYSQLIANAER